MKKASKVSLALIFQLRENASKGTFVATGKFRFSESGDREFISGKIAYFIKDQAIPSMELSHIYLYVMQLDI